jgi:cytochrome c oxidase subunit II
MTLLAPLHDALSPAGPAAASIARLFWFYLTFLTFITVLVIAALLWAVIRQRSRAATLENPSLGEATIPSVAPPERTLRTLDAGGERRTLRRILRLSIATLAALVVLLLASIWSSRALYAHEERDPVHIELTGAQWWWKVRYLNGDPSQIFITANELHIPVGRPVSIRLLSADVIHSFWIPNLQGKRDLIPGHESSIWISADEPGVYRANCAEFCGLQHANMALTVVVEPNEAYEAWCAAQRKPAPAPSAPSAARGQELFQNGPCASCHAVSGTAAQGSNGPDLSHFRSRLTLGAGTLANTKGHLAGWVVNSQAHKPGNRMPSISLAPRDLQDLLAYLETLR